MRLGQGVKSLPRIVYALISSRKRAFLHINTRLVMFVGFLSNTRKKTLDSVCVCVRAHMYVHMGFRVLPKMWSHVG